MDTLDDASIYRICEQSDLITLRKLRQTSKKIRETCSQELLEVKAQELASHVYDTLTSPGDHSVTLFFSGYPGSVIVNKYDYGEAELIKGFDLSHLVATYVEKVKQLIPGIDFSRSREYGGIDVEYAYLTGTKIYNQREDFNDLLEDLVRFVSLPSLTDYKIN